jgi:hypothetical protein
MCAVGSSGSATVIVEVTPARESWQLSLRVRGVGRTCLDASEWVERVRARVRPLHLSGRLLAAAHHGRLLISDT